MKYMVWVETEYEETSIMTEDDEQITVYHRWFNGTELAELMKSKFGNDVEYEVCTC